MRILLFLLFPLFTQALEFESFVDKTEVGLNETFVLNLQFKSERSPPKQVSVPELSQLKDFYFLNESSSHQSSIQIVNGQMSKTNVLLKIYRLQPKAIGFFKIPALSVQADRKIFKTQSIAIKVTKERASPSNQPPPSALNFPFNIPDPFNFPNSVFKGLPDLFSGPEKGSAKLKLELSKNFVYKSERIKADWFLLSSSSSIHFDLSRVPVLKGFWKQKLKTQKRFIGSEVVGKTLYKKQLIDSLWLFPLREEELELDSYSIRLSSFFRNGQIVSVPVKKIKVKSLPVEDLDKSFTGAVGDFSVKYLIKEKEGTVNEPLPLKITFEGSGHPRFINLPDIPFPSSIDSYPPVQKSQFSDKGIGKKEFEILLVPKQEGQLIIPSFTLSTFNPEISQYIYHKSPEFSILIQAGEYDNNLSATFLDTTERTEETDFLNRLPLESSYWPSFISYKKLIWFFTSLFCFFILSVCGIFIKRIILNREKSLKKEVNAKLLKIQKLLDKKDWQKACIQMIQLGTYILSYSHIKESASDWRQALKSLAPSLKERYSEDFESLFKQLESLSFSLHSQSSDLALKQAKSLFKQSKNLINQFLTHL